MWGSGFTGFNVAFISFWLLWMPEAIWLALTVWFPPTGTDVAGTNDLLWSLLNAAVILAIYALAYAIFAQALFSIVRLIAAIFSHGQTVFARITPGLAVFLLTGEPLLQQAGIYYGTANAELGLLWALAPPALLISLLVGAVLIYLSPVFRGYNAMFILTAAIAARIVLFPVNPGAGVAAFLIYQLTLLLTAFFVFITIQIRYRLHLWPNYEAVEVPERFVRIGGIIAVICSLLYVGVELPWFDSRAYGGRESAPYFVPTAVWFVCAVQWTITAWLLERGRSVSLSQQKEQIQAAVLRSLTITIAVLLAVLFAVTGFPQAGLGRLTATHSTSGELLFLTGMLLDADRDGNSLWPGQDPDDNDPCVRKDFRRACAGFDVTSQSDRQPKADLTRTVAPASARETRVTVLHDPTAPRFPRPPAGNVILITWVTAETNIPGDPTPIPIYFAANRPEYALAALLRNTDGMGDAPPENRDARSVPASEKESIPLPSALSRNGYRTICTGRAAGRSYFRTGHATHLDAGCQVFQPLDGLAKNTTGGETGAQSAALNETATRLRPSNINRTVLEGLFVFDRYREDHANFLWIHYEDPESLRLSIRDKRTANTPDHRRRQPRMERETLYRLQQAGDVILIQMPADGILGNAYLLGRRQPRELPEYPRPGELIRFAAGLQNTPPGSARDQIIALYKKSFSDNWWLKSGRKLGLDYPALPVHTLRLDDAGMPAIFNALTGLNSSVRE